MFIYLSGKGKYIKKIDTTVLIDSNGNYILLDKYIRLFRKANNATTVMFFECDRLIDETDYDLAYDDSLEDIYNEEKGKVIVKYTARVGKMASRISEFCVSNATWDWICKVNCNLA